MQDFDWILSASHGAFSSDDLPPRFRRDVRTTDLSVVIELTKRRIDEAFNQEGKIKGKVRDQVKT
jgi:hypothetical protein|tara:strand:- start:417 stop:611 length:195 start_codon:yes stop_codon:yes gene_type:complete